MKYLDYNGLPILIMIFSVMAFAIFSLSRQSKLKNTNLRICHNCGAAVPEYYFNETTDHCLSCQHKQIVKEAGNV
jgi:DNA-directed RNA polymerase subunit RPC12/RpoP